MTSADGIDNRDDPWLAPWGIKAVVIDVVPPGDWLVSGRNVYLKPEQAAIRPNV
jgi:hypothetical protein